MTPSIAPAVDPLFRIAETSTTATTAQDQQQSQDEQDKRQQLKEAPSGSSSSSLSSMSSTEDSNNNNNHHHSGTGNAPQAPSPSEFDESTSRRPPLFQSFMGPEEETTTSASSVAPGRSSTMSTASTARTPAPPTPEPSSSKPHKASTDEELEAVGRFLRQGAVAGWGIWIVVMFVTFRFAPIDSYTRLEENEQKACWVMVILLFVTNGSRILPLAFQNNGLQFMKSGILTGSFSVQCIAIISNYIMAVAPTPVLVDPMTGMRIHLVRFAAWTPLCFLMTFLTEAIDIPLQENNSSQIAWWHAIALALSTVCGGFFPFCTDWTTWWIVMAISWLLFATLYVRFYHRYTRYQKLLKQHHRALLQAKQRRRNQSHRSLNAIKESVDRARFSFHLILLCAISWTGIAVSFCVCAALKHYAPPESIWASDDLPLISGHVLECLSKIWYLSLQLQVYDRIFDEANRSVRRLEELRTLMSALWEASSDILVICAKTEQTIHAVLSPNALLQSKPSSQKEPEMALDGTEAGTISCMSTMLEISPQSGTFCSFPVDLSKPVTRVDAWSIQQARVSTRKEFGNLEESLQDAKGTSAEKNLTTIAHLALQVCDSHLTARDGDDESDDTSQSDQADESWMLQELFAPRKQGSSKESRVKCEAKVTPIDAGALLLVLRDVSERYERFEVEKQLLQEVIVRKKDAEAIRFTRHEVKNGLLAAIGIVDSLRETYEKQKTALQEANSNPSNPDDSSHNLDSYINDLDTTLQDVLEVILDNAMTREIIFEGYVPRRESVDLPLLFQTARKTRNNNDNANSSQNEPLPTREFPLVTSPKTFPDLILDPQLIRNIYQNAISNACKYGKKDGSVKTELTYDKENRRFRLEVFNLPGYAHDDLLKLSQEEVDCVFSEGTQLRANQCLETEEGKLASARSSGDGAWIMQKGAQCLGGNCGIRFTPDGTTFTLECPAVVCEEWQERNQTDADAKGAEKDEFALPKNTWAVAVEDSAMQRKLLERFLKKAGIADDRFLTLGKSNDEIFNFTNTVLEKMSEFPDDKFLLIIDENLDIVEGGTVTKTVSGSFSIKEFRENLDPAIEARMLALIRSANDSVQEVELYQSRGHGFLLKGPMKKGGLLEEIKPWWNRRFMPDQNRSTKNKKKRHTKSPSFSDSVDMDEKLGPARERIIDLVKEVDSMTSFSTDGESSNEEDSFDSDIAQSRLKKRTNLLMDWQSIRYKLMLLNVDLKTHSSVDNFALAAKSIDEITNTQAGGFLPQDLHNRWADIRQRIFREL